MLFRSVSQSRYYRSKVEFDNKTIDDQVLIKSDSYPTYHLANVVDDHDMAITHVIRGEEWISSTPKHVLLYQAFGWTAPQFAHLPLLLNPDKTKLSKRQGDVAVEDYLKKGYLPEALLNFVLLLGWNPGTEQEIFSLSEMIATFDIDRVNKSGSVFDTQKLDWLNGVYIRNLQPEKLLALCKPYLATTLSDDSFIAQVLATQQQRLKRLDEVTSLTSFFFNQPHYEAGLLHWKGSEKDQTLQRLTELDDYLSTVDEKQFTEKELEQLVKDFIAGQNRGNGEYLWPLRVALSGQQSSPGPFEIATVLGKSETINRLHFAQNLLR